MPYHHKTIKRTRARGPIGFYFRNVSDPGRPRAVETINADGTNVTPNLIPVFSARVTVGTVLCNAGIRTVPVRDFLRASDLLFKTFVPRTMRVDRNV
jgi:hypothetical protein